MDGERQDPFADLAESADVDLAALSARMQGKERLQGSRGRRKRPRYPSEDRRQRLTLDIALEPLVADVLRVIAENEQDQFFGPDPIMLGDLGTAALMIGLAAIVEGSTDIEAEFMFQHRGKRSIVIGPDLEREWAIVLSQPEFNQSLEREEPMPVPPRVPRRARKHTPRPGFVYLFKYGTFYKIGASIDPEKRRRKMSSQLPLALEQVCIIQTEDMVGLESALHQRYAAKWVKGEWFALDAGDVESIQQLEGEPKTSEIG